MPAFGGPSRLAMLAPQGEGDFINTFLLYPIVNHVWP
jgi:hypothetical protein